MRTSSLLFAAAVSAFVLPAMAEGTPAEELFNEGRAAFKRKDYDTACPKFAESLRLSGAGGPRLSLAECEEGRGHLALALEMYEEAVRVLPKGSEQGAKAAEQAAALGRRVPTLVVDLDPRAPVELHIGLDGKPLAKRVVRVDPGDHVLAVSANGCEPASVPVRVAEGEQRHLTAAPASCGGASGSASTSGSASESGSAGVAASSASPSRQRTVGFVIGGVGVAGVVAFGVTGALALGKQSTVDQHCHDHVCDPVGLAAGHDGMTLDVANAVAFGVGVLGLGAGIVLVATAPKSTAPPAVGLHVLPTPRGVTFGLSTPLAF